jgi:hypothetical protein
MPPPKEFAPRESAASARKDHGLQIVANHFVGVQKKAVPAGDSREIRLLKQKLASAAFLAGVGVLASSCGAAPSIVQSAEVDRLGAVEAKGNKVSDNAMPISDRFRSLDEYLAWLEKTQAPVDGAWYREIRPGLYELQTGNLRILRADGEEAAEGQQTFTREELERKFGFRK